MVSKTLWNKKTKKTNPKKTPKNCKRLLYFPKCAYYKLCGRQVYFYIATYAVNSYYFSARDVTRYPVIPFFFMESVMWPVVGVTLVLNLAN